MQKPWKNFTKNLKVAASLALVFGFCTSALAANGVMPIDDTDIRLPDDRTIEAVRCGVHCHCLTVKPGKYVADVNNDGNLEICVASWDGGNNIDKRYALTFSIKGNKLVCFGCKKFNLEFGEHLYE
jgi:hypothetical protein